MDDIQGSDCFTRENSLSYIYIFRFQWQKHRTLWWLIECRVVQEGLLKKKKKTVTTPISININQKLILLSFKPAFTVLSLFYKNCSSLLTKNVILIVITRASAAVVPRPQPSPKNQLQHKPGLPLSAVLWREEWRHGSLTAKCFHQGDQVQKHA